MLGAVFTSMAVEVVARIFRCRKVGKRKKIGEGEALLVASIALLAIPPYLEILGFGCLNLKRLGAIPFPLACELDMKQLPPVQEAFLSNNCVIPHEP